MVGPRNNHFNLVRMAAAFLVVVGHSVVVIHGEAQPLNPLLARVGRLASLGVDVFFVVSGYLVCRSFDRASSLLDFGWKRFLRLYPALIVAVLLCTFVVGPAVTTLPLAEYLRNPETYAFLLGKASQIGLFFTGGGSALPGAFENSPFPNSVNASLWTLPWEILMYVSLALILMCSRYMPSSVGKVQMLLVVLAGVLILRLASDANLLNLTMNSQLLGPLLRFSTLFFAGAIIQSSNLVRYASSPVVSALGLLGLLTLFTFGSDHLLYAVCLPLPLIALCESQKASWLLKYNEFGDFSYGTYLYAFPIQQTTQYLFPSISVVALIVVTTVVTIPMAIASWLWVERPALRLKAHFSRSAKPRAAPASPDS
ncbi:MAG: acyltransferase [Pseudomonadota bacterium]